MKLSRTAWRNLWRRKRRTFITAFTVAFGIALSVTFTGMGDYTYTNMIDTSATMGFGHLSVEPLGYNESPSLNKRIHGADAVRDGITGIPGIEAAMVRIIGQAMFASAAKTVGGAFIGMDPSQESPERNLFLRSIVEGSVFQGTDGRGVVVGIKMAEKLNVRLGRKLVYTATDIHGEIVSEIARVTGIFNTGVDEIDSSMVLLPIDRVRATLQYDAKDATLVSIFIDDQRKADRLRDVVFEAVGDPDREVLTWRETQPDIAGLIALDRAGNYLFQILVGLLIGAGILNTMLMNVLERTREFGVMMAIGLSPVTLIRLVVLESAWIGLVGIVLGIVVFAPWYAYLIHVGIDFSGMIGEGYSAGGVMVDPVMKLRLYKESAIAILAGVFTLTLAAGLYPAYRASRVLPVESLKTL